MYQVQYGAQSPSAEPFVAGDYPSEVHISAQEALPQEASAPQKASFSAASGWLSKKTRHAESPLFAPQARGNWEISIYPQAKRAHERLQAYTSPV
jgi:hypothetical protein